MKKLTIAVLSIAVILGGGVSFASAQVATSSAATSTDAAASLQAQIQQLLDQINQLKARIAALETQNGQLQTTVQQITQTLQISDRLRQGMSGDGVKNLQSVLATDPAIFSKDDITGYYGPLTAEAVSYFQKHFGLDQVGVVGPRTQEKINELLKEHNVTSTQDLSENELGDLGDSGDMMEDNNTSSTINGENERGSSPEMESEHGGDNASSTKPSIPGEGD